MELRLTQDEKNALRKIEAFHQGSGRLIVDFNSTGVNVTAFVCFITIATIFYGMVSGNIDPAFAGFLLLCFGAVLWQIGFQFRTLAELAKKQQLYINFLEINTKMPTLSDKAGKLWKPSESILVAD